MASAEEKLKDESKDRQVMGSNANGADGAEEKMEENNPSKDPKDPSGEEAELETAVSEEDVRNVEILESIADGSRKATNAELKNILGARAWNVAEKSEALRATVGLYAQELRAKEQEEADTAQICDACKEFAAEQIIADIASIAAPFMIATHERNLDEHTTEGSQFPISPWVRATGSPPPGAKGAHSSKSK
jgi:hypothetical protein